MSVFPLPLLEKELTKLICALKWNSEILLNVVQVIAYVDGCSCMSKRWGTKPAHYENLSLELNQPSNTGRCGWQNRIC